MTFYPYHNRFQRHFSPGNTFFCKSKKINLEVGPVLKHTHGLNITNQDRPIDTYRKVMNWRNSLGFPIEIPISEGIDIDIYYTI